MLPELEQVAATNGGVFDRAQALKAGYTGRQIRVLVESGLWVRLRHGIYTDRVHVVGASTAERALLDIGAARLSFGQPSVGSHESAALAYGLPLLFPATALHLSSQVGGRRGTIPDRILVHRSELPDHHCKDHSGVALTTEPRTVLDLGLRLPLSEAIAVADAALHRRLTTRAQLTSTAADLGNPAAALALLAAADGRSESPLESYSRIALALEGIEAPELQYTIRTSDGRFIARVDFWWRRFRVVGEADGLLKYDAANRDSSALRKEKLREEAIAQENCRVVRWTLAEIMNSPRAVADRLRQAFWLAGR